MDRRTNDRLFIAVSEEPTDRNVSWLNFDSDVSCAEPSPVTVLWEYLENQLPKRSGPIGVKFGVFLL